MTPEFWSRPWAEWCLIQDFELSIRIHAHGRSKQPHRHRRASPRHLLAMKIRAARQSDIADIIFLARHVGASSAEQAERIAAEVFGDEPLSQRSRDVLADLDDTLHQP